MKRIAVFCGHRSGYEPEFLDDARQLGGELANRGITLVYGGGGTGMMGTLADAALESGARVIGVMPERMVERGEAHVRLTELQRVATLHERKARMAELADAFIALPGGLGTLDELLEMLTWAQLGIHSKPVGLVNTGGYFDAFLAFLDEAVRAGFLPRQDRHRLLADRTPAGLLRQFRQRRAIGPSEIVTPR